MTEIQTQQIRSYVKKLLNSKGYQNYVTVGTKTRLKFSYLNHVAIANIVHEEIDKWELLAK